LRWNAALDNPDEPWIAVLVGGGNAQHSYDCTGW
jgi:hypothetical protein